jgi:hypothetical protein
LRPGPLLVLLLLAACPARGPAGAPDAEAAATAAIPPADPGAAPRAPSAHAASPALPGGEPDAPPPDPVQPGDLLTGPAAEQAIGESAPPPPAPVDPDAPAFLVSPVAVGPYALGLPRRAVLRALGPGAKLLRTRTAPGETTEEEGGLAENGAPLLRVVVVAGRLTEVTVLARDRRAVTAAGIGVGSTFDDALLAHGEPRRVPRGWVLSALPGVILAPADAALLAPEVKAPPPTARVGRLIVVGPESD